MVGRRKPARPADGPTERLHRLLTLLKVTRMWGLPQLGRALGCHSTKVFQQTGNRKLKFFVSLSNALGWPLDAVAGYVCEGVRALRTNATVANFDELDAATRAAHQQGEYCRAIEIARAMHAIAETAEQRALACNREYCGWDGLGQYARGLEVLRLGLRETDISLDLRLMLQSNLANVLYTLWHPTEALGVAQFLVDWFAENPPQTKRARASQAFALYVRGHTYRRLAAQQNGAALKDAHHAQEDLTTAAELFEGLQRDFNEDWYGGLANTCRGGVMVTEVILGLRDGQDAANEITSALQAVEDPESWPKGDWLESYGWWCIFGCDIALRALFGAAQDRAIAVFTNKALEIAERLDNWALREQVFELQFQLREFQFDRTGVPPDRTLDEEDIALVLGTMGRFPPFYETGWRILSAARIVGDLPRSQSCGKQALFEKV